MLLLAALGAVPAAATLAIKPSAGDEETETRVARPRAGREPKQITRSTRERAATYAEGDGVVRFAAS